MTDFLGGIAHASLGLLGIGSVYNPLGDLKSKLSTMKSNLQEVKNMGAYNSEKEGADNSIIMVSLIKTNDEAINETMDYFHTLSMDNTAETNYFLILLSVLVIIIIFFMLIR